MSYTERTRRTDDVLEHRLDVLYRATKAVESVLNGETLATACRTNGFDYSKFVTFINSGIFLKVDTELAKLSPNDFEKDPFEVLYCDIFGENEIAKSELPIDIGKTTMLVLETLTDRERDIVIRYYGINGEPAETYIEIGSVYGVTRERIRQVHQKALRKLRHPHRAHKLILGLTMWEVEQECKQAELETRVRLEREASEERIRELREAAYVKPEPDADTLPKAVAKWTMTDLNDFDLSVRSLNALKRARVNTVLDMLRLTKEEMTKIRNMGQRSIVEVMRNQDLLLEPYGVKHDDFVEWMKMGEQEG